MTDDDAIRWLIVCDCAGHPDELIGVVDLNATGQARVWNTGTDSGSVSLKGANRLILGTPADKRADVMRELQTRETRLRATVTFSHTLCGKSIRVNEDGLGELFAMVSTVIQDQRVPLGLLCAVNGRLQRGRTR